MWYFSWILGLGLACAFGILNAMWFEFRDDAERAKSHPDSNRPAT
jgi:cyd operon protein YbgT